MSAPVTERVATRGGAVPSSGRTGTAPAEIPAQRSRPRRPATEHAPGKGAGKVAGKGAGKGTAKALARRDDRLSKLVGDRLGRTGLGRTGLGRAVAVPGRTPFALLVMGLLTIGLVATLWLSTAAAADSYALSDARAAATALREQSETLRREVADGESAPAVIAAAQNLGMAPAQDPPRLVVAPDGSVTVVGTPHAVTRPAPIVPPVVDPAVPQAPPAEAETQAGDPAGGATAGSPGTPATTGTQAGTSTAAGAQTNTGTSTAGGAQAGTGTSTGTGAGTGTSAATGTAAAGTNPAATTPATQGAAG